MKKNRNNAPGGPHSCDRLRELFRAGDPAADGREPTPEETAAWKRRIMTEPAAPARHWPVPTGWAAATAAVVAIAFLAIWFRPEGKETVLNGRDRPDETLGGPGFEAGRMGRESTATRRSKRDSRTIQFRAPNGTRIIWTLNPDLSISGTDSRDRIEGETS